MPFDQTTADQLLANGSITPDTHQAYMDQLSQAGTPAGSPQVTIDPAAQTVDPSVQLGAGALNPSAPDQATTSPAQQPYTGFDPFGISNATTPDQVPPAQDAINYAKEPLPISGRSPALASNDDSVNKGSLGDQTAEKKEPGAVDVSQLANAAHPDTKGDAPNPKAGGIDDLNAGFNQDVSGVNEKYNADLKIAADNAASNADFQKQMEVQEIERKMHEENNQSAISAMTVARQNAATNYVDTHFDPNNFWHTAGTGTKIGSAIGMILSGFGSGASGQPNMAMDVINRAIDRDMESQKIGLEQKKNAYSMANDDLSNAYKHESDQASRDAMTKMTLYEKVKNDAMAAAAKYAPGTLKGANDMLIGQIKQKQAEIMMPFQMQMRTMQLQQDVARGSQISPQNLSLMPEKFQESAVKMPEGGFLRAGNPEQAQIVNKTETGVNSAQGVLKKLIDMQGFSLPYSDKSEMSKSLLASVPFSVLQEEGFARMSETDINQIKKELGDPTSWRSGLAAEKLKELKARFEDHRQDVRQKYLWGYNKVNAVPNK